MSVNYVFSAAADQHTAPIIEEQEVQGTDSPAHVANKMKDIDHLFNQKCRRTCAHCATKTVSWSCLNCNRHLPNGNWADLGLSAEDENDSLFSKLRQVVQSGLVKDEDEHTFAYDQAKYVLKSWIMLEDASARLDLPVIEDWTFSLDPPGWKWADANLSAEDSPTSIMGILRSQSFAGSIEPSRASDWAQFGRSVARCWDVLESVLDGSMARTPLPAALASELQRYCESAAPTSMSLPLVDGLCKYTNLSTADFEAQPPAFSEISIMMIDQYCNNLRQASITSSEKRETPRFTVGPPPKKYLKEVAKAVETNNKYLQEEQVQKEQAKEQARKDRQAKKDEAAARKSRAQGDQRRARERKAERCKQDKLQRAEKQAKVQGPRRSSQQSPAKPMVRKRDDEDSNEIAGPEPIEEGLVNAVAPSLEKGPGALAQETAPAGSAGEDTGFDASPSDNNTLIDDSASTSATRTCKIDTAEYCQCEDCKTYDLAIDVLEGGPPDETSSNTDNSVNILSPKPRPYCSTDFVDKLEQIASSSKMRENDIPRCHTLDNAFASQHRLIDGLTDGARPKFTLGILAPPSVPKANPRLSKRQRHTVRIPSDSELPNWVDLGLTAEAADDSLFSRVWQLRSLGFLTHDDEKVFGFLISKLWKQMYLATQDDPHILEAMSLPNGSGSWCWADFRLSAEGREESIFGVTKKLASLGFWSIYDEKALQNFTMLVAKRWLVTTSEDDHQTNQQSW